LGDCLWDIVSSASTTNNSLSPVETINSTNRESSDVTLAGTTTFSDPTNVVANTTISKQERSNLYPVRDQSILDFLAKPAQVVSARWNATDVSNYTITSSSVRYDLLNNPLWMEKLKGFNFIRATAVYRVVINSTPFHAGALRFGLFRSLVLLLLLPI